MPAKVKASISLVIFIAFTAMALITAAVSGYSLFVQSQARGFVTSTYDGALMAVSYARAASLDFVRMENALLRSRVAPPADRAELSDRLDQLEKSFIEDLNVIEERSSSEKERAVIADIRALSERWNRLRQAPALDTARSAIAEMMVERFDMLIELTADSSFIARHRATTQMAKMTDTSIAAMIGALMLSAAITFLLTRRIIRPLRAAAVVANRISQGELDTPIPTGGSDETGTLLRSMSVMQGNIRVMVEREQAQRRSAQNRLVEALETSREAIILVDGSHRIAIANSQLTRFFPTLAGRLGAGQRFDEAFERLNELVTTDSEEDAAPVGDCQSSQPNGKQRELLSAGSEFRLADGRWLRVSSSTTEEGGFFLIISDSTEFKEREAHLKEAHRLAEAANEAKSRFLANMSHELRTPLNAIIGFSEVLGSEMFGRLGNARYVEYARDIQHSGNHLLAVINNVLDLTRSEAGKLQLSLDTVDLGEIVDSCAKIMRDQCVRAELSLSLTIPNAPLVIHGDPAKLRQILLNLMSNAIKFTAPGGAVTVAAQAIGNGSVAISVTDTGIGMSAEDLPVAMAPFGQIDSSLARRYEGTGLGLPLTKAFVELHGGRIAIDSEPEKGTVVTVALPGCSADDPVRCTFSPMSSQDGGDFRESEAAPLPIGFAA
ncbi:MAG TPA: ATP-binding protein [Stellaceae bacterium]|jgi:signal transduction histidine kinase|nr:ATP-binding protein [Stellaceae bacterium]